MAKKGRKSGFNFPIDSQQNISDTAGRISRVAELFTLDEIDQKIIEYKIKFPEITYEQIATLVERHPKTIEYRLKKPAMAKAIQEMTAPTLEIFESLTHEAALVFRDAIRSNDPYLRFKAASAILKFSGQYLSLQRPSGPEERNPTIEIFANVVRDDGELIKQKVLMSLEEWEEVRSGRKSMLKVKFERGLISQDEYNLGIQAEEKKDTLEVLKTIAHEPVDHFELLTARLGDSLTRLNPESRICQEIRAREEKCSQ